MTTPGQKNLPIPIGVPFVVVDKEGHVQPIDGNVAGQTCFKMNFQSWGVPSIGHACLICGKSCCEEGEAWLAYFGLRRVGLDVLWFVIHHCRDCDAWERARHIANQMNASLVAGPQSVEWKEQHASS